MLHLRSRLDLAMKAADGIGRGQTVGADDFYRDEALHQEMASLEDRAHATLTEALQQHVRSQTQGSAVALKELIHLKRRQPLAADQLGRQRTARRKALAERLQLGLVRRFEEFQFEQ